MKEKINRVLQQKTAVPLLFLLLVMLAYGLLLPWLGYYWDDWPFAWFLKFFGPSEFIQAFRPFRPLLGPIFQVTTSIFGGHPLVWQSLGLVIRLLLGLQVWSLLRKVWPARQSSILWVALLFTVYPAYGQQWVALTHVNQELIPLLLLLSSFILTTRILRQTSSPKYLPAFAVLLQALGLFSTEYFFGLEILRFCFILVILAETMTDRQDLLKKSLLQWAPYWVVWIVNAIWTYFYHRSAAYTSYGINVSSLLSPLALANEFITTLSLSGFTSWLGTFHLFAGLDGSATQLIALAVFLISGGAVYLVMQANAPLTSAHPPSHFGWQAAWIGLVGIFAGRLPSWAAGLPLKIEFDYDRFFVSIMLGAGLFIIGLADLMLKEKRAKPIFLSILIGMSTAYQFTAANTYRRDWANQQEFFWQLAWRAPAIQENTALLTHELPFKYASDLQLTAPLNWIYSPDLQGREIPYVLFYLKTRFDTSTIKADQPIHLQYRTVEFNGSTSNSLVIFKEADGCLRVLDPVYGNGETVPGASAYLLNAIPLSDPSRIVTDAPAPALDETLFGSEPSHAWCYFYAQAETARLENDWEGIVKIYQQAQAGGFSAWMPVENLPFIEALAMTGEIDKALKLTERTIKGQEILCPALVTLWDRVSQTQGRSLKADTLLQDECRP